MKNFDVYAYGVIASSTLHILSQSFPAPDGYAEISQSCPMTGGEALNSSIVLSRLGLSVRLDGNWIGDTPEGMRLLATIQALGIDASRLRVKKGYAGILEIVFSDERTRTIFGNYIDLLSSTRKWNIPRKTDIAGARIACIDPPYREESSLAGRYAVESGVPYVSIDCSFDRPLATEAAAIIVSGEFRDREYPHTDLIELFHCYQQSTRGLAVFTVGSEDILYARKGEAVNRFKPYRVKVLDSAGAGDSFRSGLIYGLLQKWRDDEVIRYASAVAGMVCATFPGVLKSPTHAEVMRFIRAQTATHD